MAKMKKESTMHFGI